jgi:hypothetical protein
MEVRPIASAEACEFIRLHHYAKSAQAGVLHYGWYEEDELLGVSIYNNGFRNMQEGVFGKDYALKVLHHHRLAITPEAREKGFKVSKFIRKCNQLLANEGYDERTNQKGSQPDIKAEDYDFWRPSYWAVVTYADLDFVQEGKDNPGHIYRITGAQYTGTETKGNLYFTDEEGGIRSVSKSLSKAWDPSQGGTDWSARIAEAERRGWTKHRSKGKLRFVYLLGNKTERRERRELLKWPVLPYPT